MKVKDLIKKLVDFDPELMVVRDGYEGGVTEVTEADEVKIALNVNQEWYYGEHDVLHDDDEHQGHERAQAVRIY